MTEHALPRSETKISFEACTAFQRPRYSVARAHAARVQSIRLGTSFHGQPIWSVEQANRALCGVHLSSMGSYDGPVNCPVCLARLRKLERSGADAEGLAASVALGTSPA